MTGPRPPRLALHVLRALRVDDESLVGDIVEEFGTRRSRLWLWRQVLGAIVAGPEAHRRTGPLGLCDARFAQSVLRPTPRKEPRINLSGGPVPGIGGLSIVAPRVSRRTGESTASVAAGVRPDRGKPCLHGARGSSSTPSVRDDDFPGLVAAAGSALTPQAAGAPPTSCRKHHPSHRLLACSPSWARAVATTSGSSRRSKAARAAGPVPAGRRSACGLDSVGGWRRRGQDGAFKRFEPLIDLPESDLNGPQTVVHSPHVRLEAVDASVDAADQNGHDRDDNAGHGDDRADHRTDDPFCVSAHSGQRTTPDSDGTGRDSRGCRCSASRRGILQAWHSSFVAGWPTGASTGSRSRTVSKRPRPRWIRRDRACGRNRVQRSSGSPAPDEPAATTRGERVRNTPRAPSARRRFPATRRAREG